ncbi:MAG TPA: hypothetical protein VGE29_02470 [Prosthecobacter sp.]
MDMSFLKRFEVWLLILLCIGAGAWVFITDREQDGNPESLDPAAAVSTEPAVKILRCTLERDYGNARLDIELRYRNASPRPLILQPPDVRLLTADGKEVPPFVLAVEKFPQIAAQTAQDVRLRYWLDKTQLQGGLTLDIRGATAPVKTQAPLDLESLENRKPKTWFGPLP